MGQNKNYTRQYKKQGIKTVIAILFFLFIYLIVIALSFILISFLLVEASLMLNARNILVNILGIVFGLISLMILAFLIVFFFRRSTTDRSDWIEIQSNNQPKLFELIKSIAEKVHTRFPDKVYFSPNVEAAVFYDSNFWNLFFPNKENLMIGFGLLNCINKGELEAILAHEFGHFSQRRLSIYSFVYIENQIIYKMLIDQKYYNSLLQKFWNYFGPFTLIVSIYSSIIRVILSRTYQLIYKTYMAMSREMEFRADEIAANISGWKQLTSSLRRLELGFDSFNSVMEFYYNLISENTRTENIYINHYFALMLYADKFELEIDNGLPKVKKSLLYRFVRSKLKIDDQWASHPNIFDRIEKIKGLNNKSNSSKELAWELINNKDELQKKLTTNLFKHWRYTMDPANITAKEFDTQYSDNFKKYSFNKIYNYFYDFRDITKFDVEKIVRDDAISAYTELAQIYSDKNVERVHMYNGLDNDLKVVEAIVKKEFKVINFEYDGVKYKIRKIHELQDKLMQEHKILFDEINKMDIDIFKYFYAIAKINGEEKTLIKKYLNYFNMVEEDKNNLKIYLDLINSMQFIVQFKSSYSIEAAMEEFKAKESLFKEKLRKLITDELLKSTIDPAKVPIIEAYLSKDWDYYEDYKYDEEALAKLEECIFLFYYYYSKAPLHLQKDILDYQVDLLN